MELTFEQLPKAVVTIIESLERIENLLSSKSKVGLVSDRLMTVKDAAEYLSITSSAIYKLTHTNKIPFNKKGKRVYFLKSDILEWVKSGKIKTSDEIAVEAEKYILTHRNKFRF